MAVSLMRAGYPVIGYDVVVARRRDHVPAGGRAARNVREVGAAADIIICSLP